MISDLTEYWPLFSRGLMVTLTLSGLSSVIATVLGILAGVMRSSRSKIARIPAAIFIETFRSIPILILLFFAYYALPLLLDVNVPQFAAGVVALSCFSGAYMGEVVRSALLSIPPGHVQASLALGFGYGRTLAYVIAPQALRVAIPPAVGIYIATIKDSAAAAVIGYLDLTGAALTVHGSTVGSGSITALLVAGVMYFVISWVLSIIMRRAELRLEKKRGRSVSAGREIASTMAS